MLGSIILAVDIITSLSVGRSILRVDVVSSSPLRLFFSLYVIHCSCACVVTFFVLSAVWSASTMSAASPRFPARARAFWRRMIILSVSFGPLTGTGNLAAAVLSRAVARPTVVVLIFSFTICQCYTGSVLALDGATVYMLGRTSAYEYVKDGLDAGAGRGARGVRRGCGVGLPAVCCLEVCLSTLAVATSRYGINWRGVEVAGEVDVSVALGATVLRTSLVRSATSVLIRALSSLIWSMVWFMFYGMMLSRVFIFRFIVSSIFWDNMCCTAVYCTFIADLISSSSRSFRILNRVA